MISDDISTDNLSTISASHARRDADSLIDIDTNPFKEKSETGSDKSVKDLKPLQDESLATPKLTPSVRPKIPERKSSMRTTTRTHTPPIFYHKDYFGSGTAPYKTDEEDEEYQDAQENSSEDDNRPTNARSSRIYIPTANSHVNVPKFNIRDIKKWIELYECVGAANNWNKKIMFNRLYQAFENTEHFDYFLRLMRTKIINDWKSAKTEFLKRSIEPEVLINTDHIYQRKQQPEEDVRAYIMAKETMLSEIKPALPPAFIVSQIVQGFKNKIYNKIMASSIQQPISSVDELITRATYIEQLVNSMDERNTTSRTDKYTKRVNFAEEPNEGRRRTDRMSDQRERDVQTQLRELRKAINNLKFNQPRPNYNPNFQNRYQNYNQNQNNIPPRFYRQDYQNNSPRAITPNRSAPAIEGPPPTSADKTNVDRDSQGRPRCYNCQKYGHFARECSQVQRKFNQQTQPKMPENSKGADN